MQDYAHLIRQRSAFPEQAGLTDGVDTGPAGKQRISRAAPYKQSEKIWLRILLETKTYRVTNYVTPKGRALFPAGLSR